MPPSISTKFVVAFEFYTEPTCCVAGCVQIGPGLRVAGREMRDPEAPVRGEEGGVEDDEVDGPGHLSIFGFGCGRIGI